ncbi:MAG: ADP-ribosylglycohydrolase family protein [Brevundimonas sp.]
MIFCEDIQRYPCAIVKATADRSDVCDAVTALRDAAARQRKIAHAASEAVDACVLHAEMLADAIAGSPRSEVSPASAAGWAGGVPGVFAGSWRGKPRKAINASGYVVHSLEAVPWSVGRSPRYDRAVLHAANPGQDADTTAPIAGQLAGALNGWSSMPAAWIARLAWRDRLKGVPTRCTDRPPCQMPVLAVRCDVQNAIYTSRGRRSPRPVLPGSQRDHRLHLRPDRLP